MRPEVVPSPSSRAARGRPPRPGLRDDILRAAAEVFTRRDYHEVQMEDVARACKVAKGTLYLHFRSKRDLYLAVMFEGIERLQREIDAAVHTRDPAARKIERIVRSTLGYFWDRRGFFALIHQNEHKPDRDVRQWFRQRAGLVRRVQEAIDQCIADGHVRRLDSRIATEMLFGMMRGANRYRAPEDTLDDVATAVVDILMCGIGTEAGRRTLERRARTGTEDR